MFTSRRPSSPRIQQNKTQTAITPLSFPPSPPRSQHPTQPTYHFFIHTDSFAFCSSNTVPANQRQTRQTQRAILLQPVKASWDMSERVATCVHLCRFHFILRFNHIKSCESISLFPSSIRHPSSKIFSSPFSTPRSNFHTDPFFSSFPHMKVPSDNKKIIMSYVIGTKLV